MILNEVVHSDNFLISEAFVGWVEWSEKIIEFESSLLSSLDFTQDVGVSWRVKLIFHFVEFKSSTLVDVKMLEGFLNKAKSLWLHFCDKIVKEKLVLDLTGSLLVIDFKGHL